MQAGELRSKIELYSLEKTTNELEQDIFEPRIKKRVWAKIVPQNGRNSILAGDVIDTLVTHKVIVRRGLELKADMFFKYKGQKYSIKYWQPVYNNTSFLEICAELEQNS